MTGIRTDGDGSGSRRRRRLRNRPGVCGESLRVVTVPIQSQGIITRDNVSVDVSAVACFRVADAQKPVVAVENVNAAINQIAQTTLRKVVGRRVRSVPPERTRGRRRSRAPSGYRLMMGVRPNTRS
ncbi:SPFH domain-containing protein [Streptomyces collinus]|uniref:SPFH domain-containing protein n=1 Tax=Streptomyces collinus TaxID=42684 RepID=UPI0036E4F30B